MKGGIKHIMKFEKILFLGPHPDDEFGCSGSLIRLLEEGKEIFFAVFSFCEESVPPGFPKDILRAELDNSLKIIGIKDENTFKFSFKVRHFPKYRQEILEELIILKNKINPDLVLLPALSDIHQDHHTIATEGLRAFKHCTVLGYEFPMNILSFQHACFIKIEESHLNKKIKALTCYKSQSFRPYSNEEFIRGLAKVRGIQIGEDTAEAFEVLKLKI